MFPLNEVATYDQAEVHQTANEDFDILEHTTNIANSDLLLSSGRDTLIVLQPRADIGSFLRMQEFCVFREVREQEEEGEGDDAGQRALENENPKLYMSVV